MPIDTTTPAGSTTGTSGSTGDTTGSTESMESTGTGGASDAVTTAPAEGTEGTSGTDDGSWDDFSNIFGDDTDMPADDVDTGSSIPETPEEEPVEAKETRTNRTTTDSPNRLASLLNKPLSLPKANDFFNSLFDKMQEAFDKLKEKGGNEAKEDAKKTLKETLNNANIFKGKLLGELDKAAKEGKNSVVEAYQEILQQIEDMRASILENMRLDLGEGAKKAFTQAKQVAKNLGNLLSGNQKNVKGEPQVAQKPAQLGAKLGYKSVGTKAMASMPQPDLDPKKMAEELAEQAKTKEGIKDPKNPELLKKVADKVAQLMGSKEAKEREEKKKKFDILRGKLSSITQGILNHAKAAGKAADGLLNAAGHLMGSNFQSMINGHVGGAFQLIGFNADEIENEETKNALIEAGVLRPKGSKNLAVKTEKPIPTDHHEVAMLQSEMNNKYKWGNPNLTPFSEDFGIPTEEESNTSTIGNLLVTEDLESVVI